VVGFPSDLGGTEPLLKRRQRSGKNELKISLKLSIVTTKIYISYTNLQFSWVGEVI
jgi:hypothetical protein